MSNSIKPNAVSLRSLFDKVNEDSARLGNPVVLYSDVEYYEDQISNLYGHVLTDQEAAELASALHEGLGQ